MSEVRVTTLKDTSGSNSSTTAEIASGRAKAWVNFNGTSTVAIRANFNVNSITDNGTGDYTVNFTTTFADANYAGVFGGNLSSANDGFGRIGEGFSTTGTYTSSSCRIKCIWQGDGSTHEDKQIINLAIFR